MKRRVPLNNRSNVLRQRGKTYDAALAAKRAKPVLSVVPTQAPTSRQRIVNFLANIQATEPCLVMDLAVVRRNYGAFRKALPQSSIYYAVKANPEPAVLRALAALGSSFDTASPVEIEAALAAGATPDRISYGNTIKKERDIARAHQLGITLFAVDCMAEVEKVARAAPGAQVFCRILVDNEGAEWALSRKFGCEPSMAVDVLKAAAGLGLDPVGVSFHVGSQQPNTAAWDKALASVAGVFKAMDAVGVKMSLINMGGGFPTRYLKDVPSTEAYGHAIYASLRKHFGSRRLRTIVEPGRGMVGDAGIIRSEVVLISTKSAEESTRWVYLDIGKFGGLAETMDESIRYPITSKRDGDAKTPCIIAGPTCDSVDVLYEKKLYPLPETLQIGDEVLIEATGAYTTAYCSVGFNGFAPLKTYCIE